MSQETNPSSPGVERIPEPPARVLLLFVDGVGLAPAGESNPLHTVPTPALESLLGTSLVLEAAEALEAVAEGLALVPLDACLGVEGLPQSATGQTALFTGVNAPRQLGRHVTAFPGPRLKALINEHSLLRRARKGGRRVTFANAYTPGYFDAVERGQKRLSATTLTALAAGVTLRGIEDLLAGEAVTWDVCRDLFGRGVDDPLPPVEPAEAGRHLATLAARHDLTLWETFLTDLAGHGRPGASRQEALRRVDGLLGGVLEHRPPELTVVLTSDHGNLEDAAHTRHTTHPVPLLAVGPHARRFRALRRLTEVTPKILELLELPERRSR